MTLLGDTCTRFCHSAFARWTPPPHPAAARREGSVRRGRRGLSQRGLDAVVQTAVDRDDLPDGGACAHFAAMVRAIKAATASQAWRWRPPCRGGSPWSAAAAARPLPNPPLGVVRDPRRCHRRFLFRRPRSRRRRWPNHTISMQFVYNSMVCTVNRSEQYSAVYTVQYYRLLRYRRDPPSATSATPCPSPPLTLPLPPFCPCPHPPPPPSPSPLHLSSLLPSPSPPRFPSS